MEIVGEKKNKKMNVVTEVSIFAIVFGGIMSLLAYFAFTGIKNAPDLWGLKRSIALGAPLAALAAIFFVSGVLLLTTRSKLPAYFVLLGGMFLCCIYAFFEISTIGLFGAKLMSIISYTIAVAIIIRAWNAVQYISTQSPNNEA